ncbi:Fc.00g024400.m01.CDS01 [Cosmosporella sp. VM-42]
MSETQQRDHSTENSEEDVPQSRSPPDPTGGRKPTKELQKASVPEDDDLDNDLENEIAPRRSRGRRIVPVHQSRIKDRPAKVGEKDSSLKIKIELDLEVEVEIYARVKGDVTIGLM